VTQAHAETLADIGIKVLERGWLSSNNVLFRDSLHEATLVDTGYATHAEQTVQLLESALDGATLTRIINTHLHSDHCGGNAALCARWNCRVAVPEGCFDAAQRWDQSALTFAATGQRCERFPVHDALRAGTVVDLGGRPWEIHSAPGHDPSAVMLFEPNLRVLISGDALWRTRVAIIFPELVGESGFGAALDALATIEKLSPLIVIPGHGPAFAEVGAALEESRSRLLAYAKDPAKHRDYAGRALLMFHMLEHRSRTRLQLRDWAASAELMRGIHADAAWLDTQLERLTSEGALLSSGENFALL
jgi:glyoxylase-like metal-dependent hydrolase (beta-lactamase superfamily II)